MRKHSIRLHPLGKEIRVNDQTPLIDVLHEFGIEFPCGGKGTCGKCKVRLLDGEIHMSEAHQQKTTRLGLSGDWRLACLSKCTGDISLEIEQFNHLILADESDFEFIPASGLGIAIDLGTTTVVAQLVDLSNAKVLAVETMLNPQIRFGSDLISRIQACIDGNAAEMTRIIRSSLGTLIDRLLANHPTGIESVVLVGNTAMQLIFSNSDVSSLASYPFHVSDPGSKTFDPKELGWKVQVKEPIHFYPSIASFVGSDILAGIVATGMHKKESFTALIDLGTNGEIAVGNKNQIVCASTAAGPAFEGSNISMGMRAQAGAISSLTLDEGNFRAHVIGNTPPKGICGSALIDAVAILRKLDLIGMFGEINSGEENVIISGDVKLSQKDINEFLLAKAAIAAGLAILLKNLSISSSDLTELYIAGGFGSFITLENLTATGMVELPEEKIRKIGNTALIGAKMFLFAENRDTREIIAKTRHVRLEGDVGFQDIYVERMMLL